MFKLGMGELLVIFFIVLLIFGVRRLPEIGKALGESIKEFKRAGNQLKSEAGVEVKE